MQPGFFNTLQKVSISAWKLTDFGPKININTTYTKTKQILLYFNIYFYSIAKKFIFSLKIHRIWTKYNKY